MPRAVQNNVNTIYRPQHLKTSLSRFKVPYLWNLAKLLCYVRWCFTDSDSIIHGVEELRGIEQAGNAVPKTAIVRAPCRILHARAELDSI